jgi:transcriptional regulator of met regulon
MLLVGLLSNAVYAGQGYCLGLVFEDENAVKIVNVLVVMVVSMSNGMISNLPTANWFIVFLSKISPSKYSCEAFLHAFTN